MSYKPSSYVKNWEKASKVIKICEDSAESDRSKAASDAANAESNVRHQKEWLKKAEPALKDLKSIPE